MGEISKYAFDSPCFSHIIGNSTSTVRINIVNFFGLYLGFRERQHHSSGRIFSSGFRHGNMICTTGQTISDDFSVNVSVPFEGMLHFLQNQNCPPLSHDEAIPLLIKRPAGLLWGFVFLGQNTTQSTIGAKSEFGQGSFRTPCKNHICFMMLYFAIGLANSMIP